MHQLTLPINADLAGGLELLETGSGRGYRQLELSLPVDALGDRVNVYTKYFCLSFQYLHNVLKLLAILVLKGHLEKDLLGAIVKSNTKL